ncbi:hypothetical protein ACLOJK_040510 [Asimina triloba]
MDWCSITHTGGSHGCPKTHLHGRRAAASGFSIDGGSVVATTARREDGSMGKLRQRVARSGVFSGSVDSHDGCSGVAMATADGADDDQAAASGQRMADIPSSSRCPIGQKHLPPFHPHVRSSQRWPPSHFQWP